MKSPYEPLRLASLRDVALKSSFLLALTSARQVIQHAHVDVSEKDMRLVRVKAHEVRAVPTSA
ncbi:hypothetical protein E2C01_055110 [Portunus trituberculatus]|uniref:Uncharacterized protein n=1 Tax=Portunus trituberculatus TaxID=210409 RepID=A0A5B7GV26_PORTR|nr:hypothetical protein [Portunus trituberculatus]